MNSERELRDRMIQMEEEIQRLQQTQPMTAQQGEREGQTLGSYRPTQPEKLDGNLKIQVGEWISSVEYFARFHRMDDRQLIEFVPSLFSGTIFNWWQRMQEYEEKGQTAPISNWQQLKGRILDKFQPFVTAEMARDKLAVMKQNNMTVVEYANSLHEIAMAIPDANDAEKKDRFIRGLKMTIRKEVVTRRPVTLEDAIVLAERFESVSFLQYGRGDESEWKRPLVHTARQPRYPDAMEIDAVQTNKGSGSYRTPRGPPTHCYNCKRTGHYATDCKEKRRINDHPLNWRNQQRR